MTSDEGEKHRKGEKEMGKEEVKEEEKEEDMVEEKIGGGNDLDR